MTRDELHKLNVVVLSGGWSDEREISMDSGRACMKALLEAGFEHVTLLDVADEGFVKAISEGGYDVAFVAMHGAWRRLRDPNKALSYLRQAVVNKARSVLRHRAVVEKHAPKALPDAPSAEHGALNELERAEVVNALRALPTRQREAIVLRYYGDLSEAQIADAMGISRGAVKSHTARGISTLRKLLEQTK